MLQRHVASQMQRTTYLRRKVRATSWWYTEASTQELHRQLAFAASAKRCSAWAPRNVKPRYRQNCICLSYEKYDKVSSSHKTVACECREKQVYSSLTALALSSMNRISTKQQ